MQDFAQSELCRQTAGFHCPRYHELPTLELYMDQVLTLTEQTLAPLCGEGAEPWVTGPMVNNYTKQGLLARPQKKRYTREHLAYLLFICVTKQVLSIPDINRLMDLQRHSYDLEKAYDYFCTELENALETVFVTRALTPDTALKDTQETRLLRAVVTAVAQKVYLSRFLQFIDQEAGAEGAKTAAVQ